MKVGDLAYFTYSTDEISFILYKIVNIHRVGMDSRLTLVSLRTGYFLDYYVDSFIVVLPDNKLLRGMYAS